MQSPRRGRSAVVSTAPEGEQTVSEESADMDTGENTADIAVELTGEQEAAGNGGTETEEMTVDLEVKDSTPIATKPPVAEPVAKPVAPKPTVEVMIEGLSDSGNQTKVADTPADNTLNTSVVKNTDTNSGETSPSKQIGSTETAVTEESLTTVAKVESDVSVVAAATEPTDTGSQESVDTNETAEPSTQTATTTAEPSKVQSKPEAKQSTAATVTKPLRIDRMRPPFPYSLAKLRNLTVNIGPIRLIDLKSEKLHDVLKLNNNFEIKFELRDKNEADGKILKEKSGFIRLPFEITTPTFLIRVAHILGNLHIDDRDMSVKFPEAFNKALADCEKYVEDGVKIRMENLEIRKRQIGVKNVPANVTEETVRSLFPEAQTITLNMESTSEGSKVGSVTLDFESEEACIQCLDMNKDVFIEDNQLQIFRRYTGKQSQATKSQKNRGRGSGRGRGNIQLGGSQPMRGRGRVAGVARGRGAVSARRKPVGRGGMAAAARGRGAVSARGNLSRGPRAMGPPLTTPRGRYGSSRYQGQLKDVPVSAIQRARQHAVERQRAIERQRGSHGGLGNLGYGQQRRDEPQRSPYRIGRSPQLRSVGSYRADTSSSPARSPRASANKVEGESAIMAYLQTTLSRMEQKMSSRDHNDQSYDRQGAQSRNGNQFGGMNRRSSSNQNRSNKEHDRGNQNRKRAATDRAYGQQAKRQSMSTPDRRRGDSRKTNHHESPRNTDQSRRDSRTANQHGSQLNTDQSRRDSRKTNHRGSQRNTDQSRSDSRKTNHRGSQRNTGRRRDSVTDYRYDDESSNLGNRSGAYGGGNGGTRRDSYDSDGSGYGESQFMNSGGGGRW